MAGATFIAGETKVRPGVYFRITNIGGPTPSRGIGHRMRAGAGRLGPLGTSRLLTTLFEVDDIYGQGFGTEAFREPFRGGAMLVRALRIGSGGTAATLNLADTGVPTPAVRINAKYPGTRGNTFSITVRNSLSGNPAERELVVYESGTQIQTIAFASGAAAPGEPQRLVDAVTASNSQWITATKLADGSNLLAAITNVLLTTGADVSTVTGTTYTSAMAAVENDTWDWIVMDTHDPNINSSLGTYLDRVRKEGKFAKGLIAEPTTIPLADRLTSARAFNTPEIVYVANGFKGADGVTRDGYTAAARVGGMIVSSPVTASLTHSVVNLAVDLVGALPSPDIVSAITSGALVFSKNSSNQVVVEYGITTYTTLNATEDAGWKKIRRLRTRDSLMTRIAQSWDTVVGQLNNDADGRSSLVSMGLGIINTMIREGALSRGVLYEDPTYPPAGDSAWFVAEVDDLDSLEHIYLRFGLRFSPPAEVAVAA